MKRMSLVLALCLICLSAFAQEGVVSGALGTYANPGAGNPLTLRVVTNMHTITAIPASSPATCSLRLEGSLDGNNWFDLSGPQSCTSAIMFHIVNKPIAYVRSYVIALTGGTVTVQYLGVQ